MTVSRYARCGATRRVIGLLASTKRDLIAIGASALLTSFLAVPIQHRETVSVGHQIVLWLPVWIVLAAAIRLVALVATTLKSRAR